MTKIDRLGWATGIAVHSYGLRIGIRVNEPDLLQHLPPLLPPGWKPAASPTVAHLYSLRAGGTGQATRIRQYHLLYAGPARLARSLELERLLEHLESDLQLLVAEAAPRHVFVNAGVVGWQGCAILIPGRSMSGKTTPVAALVRAGATYYSDEFAVLDTKGRVHPYPRHLSTRDPEGNGSRRCPAHLLGKIGTRPLPVGLIAVTNYRPGARWAPRALPPGLAALALLANTVPAIRRPDAVMATLRQLACQAAPLKGTRGEAEQVVPMLLKGIATSKRHTLSHCHDASIGEKIDGTHTDAVASSARGESRCRGDAGRALDLRLDTASVSPPEQHGRSDLAPLKRQEIRGGAAHTAPNV